MKAFTHSLSLLRTANLWEEHYKEPYLSLFPVCTVVDGQQQGRSGKGSLASSSSSPLISSVLSKIEKKLHSPQPTRLSSSEEVSDGINGLSPLHTRKNSAHIEGDYLDHDGDANEIQMKAAAENSSIGEQEAEKEEWNGPQEEKEEWIDLEMDSAYADDDEITNDKQEVNILSRCERFPSSEDPFERGFYSDADSGVHHSSSSLVTEGEFCRSVSPNHTPQRPFAQRSDASLSGQEELKAPKDEGVFLIPWYSVR